MNLRANKTQNHLYLSNIVTHVAKKKNILMSSETVNVLSHKQQKSTLTDLRGLTGKTSGGLQNYWESQRIRPGKQTGIEGKQPEQEPQLMQWNTAQPSQQPTPQILATAASRTRHWKQQLRSCQGCPGTRLSCHCWSYSPSQWMLHHPTSLTTSKLLRMCYVASVVSDSLRPRGL